MGVWKNFAIFHQYVVRFSLSKIDVFAADTLNHIDKLPAIGVVVVTACVGVGVGATGGGVGVGVGGGVVWTGVRVFVEVVFGVIGKKKEEIIIAKISYLSPKFLTNLGLSQKQTGWHRAEAQSDP